MSTKQRMRHLSMREAIRLCGPLNIEFIDNGEYVFTYFGHHDVKRRRVRVKGSRKDATKKLNEFIRDIADAEGVIL